MDHWGHGVNGKGRNGHVGDDDDGVVVVIGLRGCMCGCNVWLKMNGWSEDLFTWFTCRFQCGVALFETKG